MRKTLDCIYRLSGAAAVCLLVLIGVLTVAQVIARVAGTMVPSADDFATFAMAGAIFLGLTYTYRTGGHVRVLMLQHAVPAAVRRWIEGGCLAATAGVIVYLLWYTVDMMMSSHAMNEHTVGLIPVPTWMPMSFMLVGFLVLFLALIDDLVAVLGNRETSYAAAEAAEGMPPAGAE